MAIPPGGVVACSGGPLCGHWLDEWHCKSVRSWRKSSSCWFRANYNKYKREMFRYRHFSLIDTPITRTPKNGTGIGDFIKNLSCPSPSPAGATWEFRFTHAGHVDASLSAESDKGVLHREECLRVVGWSSSVATEESNVNSILLDIL